MFEPDSLRDRIESAVFDPPPRTGWRKKAQIGTAVLFGALILESCIIAGHAAWVVEAHAVHWLLHLVR